MPKHVSSGLLFGDPLHHPGARPRPHRPPADARRQPVGVQRHLCTAPDFPGRLKAIQARGGKVVVVDPRRTRTAEEADEHVAIRPGTDAHLLLAMVQRAVRGRPGRPRRRSAAHVAGLDELRAAVAPFTPEAVAADRAASTPTTIRRLARELAAAPTRRGLRPHRHPHGRVRHARLVGRRRAQRRSPATSTGPAAPCSRWPPTTAPGRARAGPRLRHRPPPQPGEGLPRGAGRVPRGHPGRRDRDAGRGPGPGPHHRGRQPGAVDARTPAASTPRSAGSTSWSASTSTSTRPPATPT